MLSSNENIDELDLSGNRLGDTGLYELLDGVVTRPRDSSKMHLE